MGKSLILLVVALFAGWFSLRSHRVTVRACEYAYEQALDSLSSADLGRGEVEAQHGPDAAAELEAANVRYATADVAASVALQSLNSARADRNLKAGICIVAFVAAIGFWVFYKKKPASQP